MTKLDTSWIEDVSISVINSASTKDEVRDVWVRAEQKRERNYQILLNLDKRFNDARAEGDTLNQKKFDALFMKRAEILQYYDDELNRLRKLWADKSGMPVFLTRKNSNFLYMGNCEEEIEIDNETMENISEKLRLILKKARRREIFSVIKLRLLNG